ncbi:hypothetical protein M2R28_09665 [Aeromonas hydrophila]|uniref:hypothetical protein n=1 Tax=Aeromonas hydrophila TaxID=644 RepID=UPI00137B13D4|nr:hypothetical protein [Aeromonas hydrophila]MCC0181080.1 hypothetical protein [Aeromonas hydrophila]MCO4116933.1 hypothetical protein [Aeromonas hydrophila]MCO4199946.1 hypothetical protein [Aeromonas hydrophila]MCR3904891.1 hypothetical protein [Aeromonas hydrophila]UNB57736.1 hypothetical protein MKW86_18495 [Aeromonas hydrophila]
MIAEYHMVNIRLQPPLLAANRIHLLILLLPPGWHKSFHFVSIAAFLATGLMQHNKGRALAWIAIACFLYLKGTIYRRAT